MKVTIDGLIYVECSHLVDISNNGWVTPAFTLDQAEAALVAIADQGWITQDVNGVWRDADGYAVLKDFGADGWMVGEGWVWDVAEYNTCWDCGKPLMPIGCGVVSCGVC